jgi:hypothetical protein
MNKYEARIEGERTSPDDTYDSWGRYEQVDATKIDEAVNLLSMRVKKGESIVLIERVDE